ncbi:MAG: FkbM family methyltransferase [Pikeienuella sp.]
MTRIASRISGLLTPFIGRVPGFSGPSEVMLRGGPAPLVAVDNLAALRARPFLQPDWLPLAVTVHDKRYREIRKAHRYFGEVIAEVTGAPPLRMLCHDDDIVAYVYLFFGLDSYESLSVRLFAAFAKEAGGVLDIGAYTGLFGMVAAAANPAAEVIAFEPMAHIVDRARLNLAMNRIANMRVEQKAISGRAGVQSLTLYGASASTTGASLASKPRSDIGSIEVEVTRIDDVAAGMKAPVRLIKLDTEGDEPAAMRGGAETFGRDGPALLAEVLTDDAVREQGGIMAGYGYRGWYVNERNRRLVKIDDAFTLKGRGYGNVIYLKGEAEERRAQTIASEFRAQPFQAGKGR